MAEVTNISDHQAGQRPRNIAIACQGGGAQAAYTAGVLTVLLEEILDKKGDPRNWVGISGTSGGALTALVAWYGALAGGRAQAVRALDAYWERNCAQLPGERIFNYLGVLSLESLDFDYQLNPYIAPLRQISDIQTRVWPLLAAFCTPLTLAMRGDFFLMEPLLEEFVDFDIVAALGRCLCIPDVIDAWHAAGVRDGILDDWGLHADGERLCGRRSISKEIGDCFKGLGVLAQFAKDNPDGLLAEAFKKHYFPNLQQFQAIRESLPVAGDPCWIKASQGDFPELLDRLRDLVRQIRDALPILLVGAVDVGSGEFVTFSSQRAPENRGISLDSVLASTTIPWLFKGKVIPDADSDSDDPPMYWDGLFSENPPISDFLSGADPDTKPDEIWVAQVNPQRCDTQDIRRRLWDRRNELSGNLSLNQEIVAAAAVNARIAMGGTTKIGDKLVQILRIAMDSPRLEEELHRDLGPATKMDRSPLLKDILFRHGQDQARAFLPVREILELAWNAATPTGAGASLAIEGLPPTGIAGLRAALKVADMHFQISDMTLEMPPKKELGGPPFEGEVLRARISWHCNLPHAKAAKGHAPRQRLEGIAIIGLGKDDEKAEHPVINRIVGARMTSIALSRPDVTVKPVGLRTLPTAA